MTKQAHIKKIVREDRDSNRTGASTIRRNVYQVVDVSTGRVIASANSKKLAYDRARFAGYTVEV